jgi:hypothetical protein
MTLADFFRLCSELEYEARDHGLDMRYFVVYEPMITGTVTYSLDLDTLHKEVYFEVPGDYYVFTSCDFETGDFTVEICSFNE